MKLKVGLIDYSTCCFEVLMQKTTSIIFILLCFLSSCSFESKTEFPAFDKEIRVDGEQSDTELLINMGWIDCVDTFLVMTHVAPKIDFWPCIFHSFGYEKKSILGVHWEMVLASSYSQ